MRVRIRVRPGSSRTAVGGQYDGAFVVRVTPRAVDGEATRAALRAVAAALGVKSAQVTLVSGATSRTKIIDVSGEPGGAVADRLAALLLRAGQE